MSPGNYDPYALWNKYSNRPLQYRPLQSTQLDEIKTQLDALTEKLEEIDQKLATLQPKINMSSYSAPNPSHFAPKCIACGATFPHDPYNPSETQCFKCRSNQ